LKDEKNIFRNIDWRVVSMYLALVLIGWINIYAAVFNEQHRSILDMDQPYGRQVIWIGTSLVIALFIMVTDAKVFNAFAYPTYGIVLLTLVAVLFAGSEVAGSKSWFKIGSFALQPAEFGKFATNLALARFMGSLDFDIRKLRNRIIPLIIIFVPALLILMQNDTGSALVYLSFGIVLYRHGLPSAFIFIALGAVILALSALLVDRFVVIGILAVITAILLLFYIRRTRKNITRLVGIFILAAGFVYSVDFAFEHVLEAHQKTRINVLLGKEIDLKGAGYNVNQSKIAIGSGGFFGKGFLRGTQTKFNFVPEQSTDFIFCTLGEEWGFLGTTAVIALFLGLCVRLIMMAERQRSVFSRVYGYGVASILFFHFFVNVGMTIGVLPVIGIPLPFFSYGGSSLWAFTILLFIFVKLDANRLHLV
jgi:rod shape determining protein RodA